MLDAWRQNETHARVIIRFDDGNDDACSGCLLAAWQPTEVCCLLLCRFCLQVQILHAACTATQVLHRANQLGSLNLL